ncbi:leucyl aminopeptidase [Ktedonosporobacter rubrisoli]|uniref:Probable cytosol aminopeptidase n=1 Tax=Ktedonosporobacter rubrisoli TaxID=2509675 RepID=A0A4V0Z043_KTERU|nr:leucyl aminopeptidase [Ktedonosporobacter rubrisoli]QBD81921.1 leucyl aminopeptidase [Ktedonosporobacter rubrisoli]
MHIQLITQAVQDIQCDALLVGAAIKAPKQNEGGIVLSATAEAVDKLLDGLISERSADGEFQGKLGEMLTLHPRGRLASRRVIVVGLGPQAQLTAQSLRRATAIAARHAQNTGAQHIVLAAQGNPATPHYTQAQVEGALLGLYKFDHYFSTREENKTVSRIAVLVENSSAEDLQQALQKGRILAEATNFARDLVNEPPIVLTPTELANRAAAMARRVGLDCEIFDKDKITELKMGGLLGVTQGSAEPPRFVILRYRGAPDSTNKGLALVGKGITFDSGGLSLKTAAGMEDMKSDMGGAAAVLGAMQAIAQLKPPINVTALVPTCENMPSGTSYRPGDILRISNGKTIEIVNTDAEGRLILSDALSYAAKEGLSPIIDLATLTGGVVVALGSFMTGLFCNDEQLSQEIISAGQSAGEKYWPMPLDDDYNEQIKSDIADIKQTGGREASSVTAAKILQNFVGDAKWAHLDIAGTAFVETKKPYQEKGATGVGVRMLAELALRLA